MSIQGPVNGGSAAEAVANMLPLPLAPPASFWDGTQWEIFWSLVEAAVPSVVDESDFANENEQIKITSHKFDDIFASLQATLANPPSRDQVRALLEYSAVKDPAFRDSTLRTLGSLHNTSQKAIGGAFSSMK